MGFEKVDKPFKAYSGDEPFIFVSYSHDDSELVFPELERIKALGYNVWYDDGLSAGNNWTNELALNLSKAALVIYIITPNSVLSRHCANEVHYALDLEKPVLAIHFRPAVLPPGLRLQLGSIQGVMKFELSEAVYDEKLRAALKQLMPIVSAGPEPDTAVTTPVSLPALPMGVVTLLRIVTVNAHGLASELGDGYAELALKIRQQFRDITLAHNGAEVSTADDAYFAAFSEAEDAVRAALTAKQVGAGFISPAISAVNFRLALLTGQPKLVENHYFGVDVQRITQISGIGDAGQILTSATTRAMLEESSLPEGVAWRDLGSHRLKDMPYPEVLFDLTIAGQGNDYKPISSLTNLPNNLPTAQTKFVGRHKEIAEICKILQQTDTRILTLTGPGGTGKTRLSIEAADKLLEHFPDGVFFVGLSSVKEPELVLATIVETLGVTMMAGHAPIDSLTRHLVSARMLLVIDNFEQIVEAADDLLKLLNACPGLKIMVSSREALHLRLEKEYAVEPLQLPNPDLSEDIATLENIESVRLFVDRVNDFKTDFCLDNENHRHIAAICIKLDGLPLALELAAARLNILSPKALLENLENSLKLLKGRSRDLPERQRTLQNTLQWSYELLQEDERTLFRQLSVFRGSFSMEASQLILEHEHDPFDLMEGIESLVKKSLLKRDLSYVEPRFLMLETIRQYGMELLKESPDFESIIERHARHYLNVAESLAPGLVDDHQRHCVTSLLMDSGNLRACMRWAINAGDADFVSRMFMALIWMWIPRGQFNEAWDWVEQAQERFQDLDDCREKALIHETAAWLHAMGGDYAAAGPYLETSHDILLTEGEAADLVRVRLVLAVARAELQVDGGFELSKQALEAARELGNDYFLALSMTSVGIMHLFRGEIPEAARQWNEALLIFQKMGNSYWKSQMLINLSHFALQAGDWSRAVELLSESLQAARKFNYPMITNLSVLAMAGVALQREKHIDAAKLLGWVQSALDKLDVTLEPLEQVYMNGYLEEVSKNLAEEEFQSAINTGKSWNKKTAHAAAEALMG
jgi:predicted ATPase/class 3 adenylate cyclase